MSKKIIISELQYRRVFLNEQFNTISYSEEELKKQKEELKRNLMDNGWPSSIISMEGKSSEEALARTLLTGMKELNRLISEKVITGVKGKYSVCVKGFGGCRNQNDGSYYMATNFDDLVNNIKGKKIGEHRVSDVVYNTDLYFNFGKVFNHVINRFKYNKNEGKSDLFPSGWWSFFKDYYGSDNYTEIKNRILSISPNEIKDNKETLNQYEKGTSIWDPSSWDMDYHDWLDVAAAILFFIPGGQPLALGIEVLNSASYAMEGDYTTGGIGLALTILPFGGPIIRRIGGKGVKKINRVVQKTNDYIKKNPKATSQEVGEFITKESKNLNSAELEALQTLTKPKNIKLIQKEVETISKLNKTELKKELTKRSDNLSEYLYGYGSKSKYWERQITASLFERILIPSIILIGVFSGKKTNKEAAKELNENGFKSITPKDIEQINGDISDLIEKIAGFDYENFEIIKQDSSKQQLLNDFNNIITIVDTVGVESNIYIDQVKPYINDSKILYDIYNIITKDEVLSDIEYRELSKDVEYKWYNFLDCEEDSYSSSIINIDNEDRTQTKDYQNKINELGSPLFLRGDSKYEYIEYNGFWFWKLKNNQSNWKLIKNCLGCSKLQRQLNKELNEINSQFDFENELNFKLDKK